jgi:hypothetical protein
VRAGEDHLIGRSFGLAAQQHVHAVHAAQAQKELIGHKLAAVL